MDIKVASRLFTVSEPFAAGHTLTEGEAHALNRFRASRLSDSIRATVEAANDAAKKEAREVTDAELAPAYALLEKNSAEFVFEVPGEPEVKLSPFEVECKAVATAILRKLLADAGQTQKTYGKDNFDAKVTEFMSHAEVKKTAQKRIDERTKVATSGGFAI